MAYETGSATGPNDMLIKLRDFATAQGWTVNRDVAAGSGRELCLSKGTSYFNLRSYQNENVTINGSGAAGRYGIAINGSDGYAGGSAWDRQPGYPLRTSSSGGDQGHANLPLPIYFGPFPSYHLFAPDSKTIYLELEVASTIFQRLGFGSLDLFNPAAPGGGRFFYATGGEHPSTSTGSNTWLGSEIDNGSRSLEEVPFRAADYTTNAGPGGSFLRAQFDSFDNWCGSARSAAYTQMFQACQGGGVHDKVLRDYSPNPLNGVGLLLPNIVSVNRNNEFLSPVGVVPGMRYMDMTLYQPGEEFSLGPDTWKVFPWYQKGGRSWQRGIAYKKVT
ncbi:structural phage protein [Pseudomonas virus Yua]|uniref:Structural phage protein n=1 Tax=Pseudomonas phage YuA TaxID=462590 RepID=A9J4X7_BPPYU|nr:structural protein [Pseudomonas virus Yua]CAO77826.1 structural phage protein [Pseudomonas virus Yua]